MQNKVHGNKENMHVTKFKIFTCVYGFPFCYYAYKTGLFAYKRSQDLQLTNSITVSKLSTINKMVFVQILSILLWSFV